MKRVLVTFAFLFFVLFVSDSITAKGKKMINEKNSVYGIVVKDINGKEINLSSYNGKVILVVNVASKCGYTKQYAGLEKIYKKYKDKGFEILGFPCNDFGGQEPGTNEEIAEFCSMNFDVSFKLFDKIKILGDDKSALYKTLINNDVTEQGDVKWNFEKFLIDKNGKILARFRSKIEPESMEIVTAIEKALSK